MSGWSGGGGGGAPGAHHTTHEIGGSDPIDVTNLPPSVARPHNTTHQNGGSDLLDVTNLVGQLRQRQQPWKHHQQHAWNGDDPFTNQDIIEAVIKRLQNPDGTVLDITNLVDGQYLKRSGSQIASAAVSGGGSDVGCRLTRSSNQSIGTSSEVAVQWNVESYINGITHSTSTNPENITIATAGKYQINMVGQLDKLSASGHLTLFAYNGSNRIWYYYAEYAATPGNESWLGFSFEDTFAANDVLNIKISLSNSGGDRDLIADSTHGPFLTIRKVDKGG